VKRRQEEQGGDFSSACGVGMNTTGVVSAVLYIHIWRGH